MRQPGRRRRGVNLAAGLVLAVAAVPVVLLGGCRRSHVLPRADGAAVVFVAPGAGKDDGVTFAPEVEPNDTAPAAHKLDLGGVPSVVGVSGHLGAGAGKARDVDLFRVTIAPPAGAVVDSAAPGAASVVRHRLSIEVAPDATLAVQVDALDDAGQLLLSAAGGTAGQPDGFPNLSVSPGTYLIRLRAATAGEGNYRLVARLSAPEAGDEVEPNGKAALASEAPPAGEVVGFLGWRHDQDWYRVPLGGLAEGSVLAVDLEPLAGVAASLLVYDAAERKLVESRGRSEERVAVRNVRVPPADPHLFVVVRADSGRNPDVRYNLRLRTELPRAGGELEPNDDPAHAQAVTEGDTLGYLGRGDVDVYRFTAAAAAELDVEVAPPERVDAKLEILREVDGMLLVRADNARRHEAERIPNLFVAPGAVLIRVSGGKTDGNPDEPYRLTVTSRAPAPGAEREPNATAAAATVLGVGAPGSGLIYPRGDVDVWRTEATAGPDGSVAVSVSGIAGAALDVRVLASADERELARFKVDGAATVDARASTGGAACCLVQVRDASPKGSAPNPRDRYTLVVGR